MILDVHGEPLFARHEARASCYRPALHHAVELEPQIVMQARRGVLLDDECVAATMDFATARFRGDAEFTLLAIFLESRALLAHDLNPKTDFHPRSGSRTCFSGSCASSPSSGACVSRFSASPMCGGVTVWRARVRP